MILFSIFCGLLVGLCLLATIVEILSESDKPYNKVETVENAGHISMDKDADERTPLLSPDTTTSKVKQDKGKISKKEDIYIDTVLSRNNLTLRLRFSRGSSAVRLRFGCGAYAVQLRFG